MSVEIACPHCGVAGQVPDAALGRSLRCPSCRQTFTPGGAAPEAAVSPRERPAKPGPVRRRHQQSSALPLAAAAIVGVVGVIGLLGVVVYLWGKAEPPRADAPPPAVRKIVLEPKSLKSVVAKAADSAAVDPTAVPPEPGAALAMLPPPEPPKPLPKGAVPLPRDRPVGEDKPPDPENGLAAHAGEEQTVADLIVTPARLPPARVAPQLLWHPEGSGFYYLEASGTLRLLAFPTLKEERVLRIGKAASRLSICDRGLLVTLPEAQELWILDWGSLDVKARVGIAGVRQVVGAQPLKAALAFCKEGNPVLVDLDGDPPRLVNTTVEHDLTASLPPSVGGFAFPTFDPAGTRLYAIGTGEQILRYRVVGKAIFLEAASPKVGAKNRRAPLCLSPDGKYVCAPGGLNAGETAVFEAAKLDAPAFTLALGPPATAVAFAPKGRLVYAQNNKFALVTADAKGVKQSDYPAVPGATAPEVFQILAHPEAKKLVLLTARGMYVVRPVE